MAALISACAAWPPSPEAEDKETTEQIKRQGKPSKSTKPTGQKTPHTSTPKPTGTVTPTPTITPTSPPKSGQQMPTQQQY